MNVYLRGGGFGDHMLKIKEEVIVEVPSQNVYYFLTHIDELYKIWHPKHHVFCKTLYKNLTETGCVFHFLEIIGGVPLYLVVKVSLIKNNQYIEYKPIFPVSIFNLGAGYFYIEAISENKTKLTAVVEFGDRFGLLEKICQVFLKTSTLRQHIKDEGSYLKRYLENPIPQNYL